MENIGFAIEISIKNEYDEKIINFIIDEIILSIKTDEFHYILTNVVEKTKIYEKGMAKRIILNAVVLDMILKLSSENIAKVIQEKQ